MMIAVALLFSVVTVFSGSLRADLSVADDARVKVDGYNTEQSWQGNAVYSNIQMTPSVQQSKWASAGVTCDRKYLYLHVYVLDGEFLGGDAVEAKLISDSSTKKFGVSASGKKLYDTQKLNISAAVLKEQDAYSVEMKIPFEKALDADAYLKLNVAVKDETVDENGETAFYSAEVTFYLNLLLPNAPPQTEATTVSKTDEKTKVPSKTVKQTSSGKSTVKKPSSSKTQSSKGGVSVTTAAAEQEEQAALPGEKASVTAESSELQLLAGEGQDFSALKVFGGAAAGILIFIGVFLVSCACKKNGENKGEKEGGDEPEK